MATYTENYNLKMPSGQDAPDVEDFNTNAEIIDTVLKAHSDNTADEYSPNETYTAGRLVIQNNALWKAKQDISVAETWTPDHWDSTTLAAELSAVNSSLIINREVLLNGITVAGNNVEYRWIDFPDVPGYTVIGFYIMSGNPYITPFVNDTGIGSNGITVVLSNPNSTAQATSENSKVQFVMMKSGPVSFSRFKQSNNKSNSTKWR